MLHGLSKKEGHTTRYWGLAAAFLSEDIRYGVPRLPEIIVLQWAYCEDMKRFFSEVRRAIGKEKGILCDSYRCALRAIGYCHDTPFIRIDGEYYGFASIQEANEELMKLYRIFHDKNGGKKEWEELLKFLERLHFLEESNRCSWPGWGAPPDLRIRIH